MQHVWPYFFLTLMAATAAFASSDGKAGAPVTIPAPAPFADRFSGDWGGLRTWMAEHGVTLDVDSTHFYQGLLSGTGSKSWEYGGRLDASLNLDTGKLRLWQGGVLRTHMEYRYKDSNPNLGGVALPTNLGVKLPLGDDEDEVEVTAIQLVQRFGQSVNFILGKINTVDLIAGDPFFGGTGDRRFFNLAFAAPPNGLTPGVIMGGLVSVKTAPLTWTLMLYDPNDRTSDYAPDDLFDDGVNVSLGIKYEGQLAGRTSSLTLTGIYSTKDNVDLGEVLLDPTLRTGRKDGSYHVSLQLAHFLHERDGHPGQGWGFFVKTGFSDGNPNPYQAFVTGGIGGKGLFACRPDDTFGLGYFYYNFSDDLQSAFDPFVAFDDEQGIELFYNVAVMPWFNLSVDFQYVHPATGANDDAFVGGLRARLRL